jgi:hypothetical protein
MVLETMETEQGAARRQAQEARAARPIDGRVTSPEPSSHDGGRIERWGKDIGRAIRDSKSRVQIGQIVAARILAAVPIDHSNPSRGAPAYWNRWEVETVQHVAQHARFARAVNENRRHAREDGVEGKEALALYLIHEGAERLAAARYPNAQDRAAFVERVRDFFAVSPDRVELIARAVEQLKVKTANPDRRRDAPTRE